MNDMDSLERAVSYGEPLLLAEGDSITITIVKGGVTTTPINHSIAAGKSFTGSFILRGHID